MRAIHFVPVLFAVVLAVGSAASSNAMKPTSSQSIRSMLAGTVRPIAAAKPRDANEEKRVELGRVLYHDPILSKTGEVSCASCHPVHAGGTTSEGLTRRGVNGKPNAFNTPTTFNTSVNARTAWRGDAVDVVELLERPFFRDACMGNKDWPEITGRLEKDPRSTKAFAQAGVTMDKVGVDGALIAYMESLTPRNAPLDRYLLGDDAALDERARSGAALFASAGCVACHRGEGVGGDVVARFGLVGDPYTERKACVEDGSYCRSDGPGCTCSKTSNVREQDLGVPARTKGDPPTYLFRVPSLRNVAVTGPWFHDGSARTLDEAVRVMAKLQLNRTLTDRETGDLVAFLSTLTGKLPHDELVRVAALEPRTTK